MEDNKTVKKNHLFLIILIIVIICCVGLIGFFVGKNYFSDKKDNKEKEEITENNKKENNSSTENNNEEENKSDSDVFDKDAVINVQELVSSPMLSQDYDVSSMSLSDKIFMIIRSLAADTDNTDDIPKSISSEGEVNAVLCDGAYSEEFILNTLKKVYSDSNFSFDELDGVKIYLTRNKEYSAFLIYNKDKKIFSYYSKPLDSPQTCSVKKKNSLNTVESVEQNGDEAIVTSTCNHCEGYHRQYTFQKINGNYYFKSVKVLNS